MKSPENPKNKLGRSPNRLLRKEFFKELLILGFNDWRKEKGKLLNKSVHCPNLKFFKLRNAVSGEDNWDRSLAKSVNFFKEGLFCKKFDHCSLGAVNLLNHS
jgi:hypothetical protein